MEGVELDMKGKVKFINHPVLNIDILESGTKIISCDHTINNIIKRMEEQ